MRDEGRGHCDGSLECNCDVNSREEQRARNSGAVEQLEETVFESYRESFAGFGRDEESGWPAEIRIVPLML